MNALICMFESVLVNVVIGTCYLILKQTEFALFSSIF